MAFLIFFLFVKYMQLQLIYASVLRCSVNTTLLDAIISDIELLGYTVQRQRTLARGSGAGLAPNTGGAYGSYYRLNRFDIDPTLPYVYKMGANSAWLMHGCTPPKAIYFGFRSYIYMNNNIWIWGD
eukprot:68957_1